MSYFDKADDVWYQNQVRGVSKLGTLMQNLSKRCNLSRVYTNHSIRATSVTILDEGNFSSRLIMKISGHRSENSLKSYSHRVKDTKKVELSHALGKALGCTPLDEQQSSSKYIFHNSSDTENDDPQANFDLVLEDMDEDEPTASVEQTVSLQNPVDVVPIHSQEAPITGTSGICLAPHTQGHACENTTNISSLSEISNIAPIISGSVVTINYFMSKNK